MRFRFCAALPLVLAASALMAQPARYAQSRVKVNVATVLLASQRVNGQPANLAPHAWYVLDSDKLVKPANWSFENPTGVSRLTQAGRDRWTALGASGLAAGQPVAKRDAPYWEVELEQTPDEVLSQFQALLLPVAPSFSLNTLEREKLRAFVDRGGLLWVDVQPVGGTQDLANGTPLPFEITANYAPASANLLHPLLRGPNPISLDDVNRMGWANQLVVHPFDFTGALRPVLSWIGPDSFRLEGVAGNAAGNTIALGRIGDGLMLVTSRAVARTLGRGLAYSGSGLSVSDNLGYQSLEPAYDSAFVAAAKLVLNGISMQSSWRGPGGGSRKTSSSPTTIQPPLLKRFTAQPGGLAANKPPIVAYGYVVASAGDRLVVYGADPSEDLDGNGDPDDGIPDALGFPGDAIWRSVAMTGGISAPVVVDVPNTTLGVGGSPATHQVWVTDGEGSVHVFALESSGSDVAPLRSIAPPSASTMVANGPLAPTIHDGLAFVADQRSSDDYGRVWVIDVANATTVTSAGPWAIQGTSQVSPPSASPTVGYIPIQDSSGGLDRVAYVPTTRLGGPNPRNAGFASLWIGARGEQPVRVTNQGADMQITTRAGLQGLPVYFPAGPSSLGIKVTLLAANGDPLPPSAMDDYLTGAVTDPGINGQILVGLTPAGQAIDWETTSFGVRVDYTIDWGALSGGFGGVPPDAFVRGSISLPDAATPIQTVVGNIAMTPGGGLLVVSAPETGSGGALYNFREVGRGEFELRSRWDLYNAMTMTVQSSVGTLAVADAITDESSLRSLVPILGQRLEGLTFASGPAVRNGTAYVMAKASKNIGVAVVPTSVLLAFRADPDPVQFYVDNAPYPFVVRQPDMVRSTNKAIPEAFSTIPASLLETTDEGNNRTRVRFKSLMTARKGSVGDAISTSLPLLVRKDTDFIVEPEASEGNGSILAGRAQGRFSPLLWYVVLDGFDQPKTPAVAGASLFVAGQSYLPSLLAGQFPPTGNGLIWGFSSDISPNDSFLRSNSVRGWHNQLDLVRPRTGGLEPSTSLLWPQFRGVNSLGDIRVRVLQAAIEEPTVTSFAVAEDTLVAQGDTGVYGFQKSDFLVVDEGRVARFDPVGNPLWALERTQYAGAEVPTAAAVKSKTLSRPTRAYPSGDGGYWLVDSGNDRVVRVDGAGRELRTITSFKVHPNHQVDGFLAGETTDLRGPRDVLVWETRHTQAEANSQFGDATGAEVWTHMLIADAGNYRIVELVDRYQIDPTTGQVGAPVFYNDPATNQPDRALGLLLWHTPETLSGKRFAYNSISRTFVGDPGDRRSVVAFGFGSLEPGRASFGLDSAPNARDSASGYGGVVLFDGAQTMLIDKYVTDAVPAGAFLVPIGGGQYGFSSSAFPSVERGISGLQSVTVKANTTGSVVGLTVMITDVYGVYELYQPTPGDGNPWRVRWMMPTEAFQGLRRPPGAGPFTAAQLAANPRQFRPLYARRLDSGDVLIVNGYYGATLGGAAYAGEVVLIDGRNGTSDVPGYNLGMPNLGFNPLSVVYELPPVQGIRGIVNPVFAERR